MDIEKNKFLIFAQGGSGGDFLCSVVNYLHDNRTKIIYKNNIVLSQDYHNFKNYCKSFDENCSLIYPHDVFFCLIGHHFHPKIQDIFSQSKIYYIDYTGYEEKILQRYKILFNETKHLQKKINLDLISYTKWKKIYELHKISSIKQDIFFSYNSFADTLSKCFLLNPDDEVEKEYYKWYKFNEKFFI